MTAHYCRTIQFEQSSLDLILEQTCSGIMYRVFLIAVVEQQIKIKVDKAITWNFIKCFLHACFFKWMTLDIFFKSNLMGFYCLKCYKFRNVHKYAYKQSYFMSISDVSKYLWVKMCRLFGNLGCSTILGLPYIYLYIQNFHQINNFLNYCFQVIKL